MTKCIISSSVLFLPVFLSFPSFLLSPPCPRPPLEGRPCRFSHRFQTSAPLHFIFWHPCSIIFFSTFVYRFHRASHSVHSISLDKTFRCYVRVGQAVRTPILVQQKMMVRATDDNCRVLIRPNSHNAVPMLKRRETMRRRAQSMKPRRSSYLNPWPKSHRSINENLNFKIVFCTSRCPSTATRCLVNLKTMATDYNSSVTWYYNLFQPWIQIKLPAK